MIFFVQDNQFSRRTDNLTRRSTNLIPTVLLVSALSSLPIVSHAAAPKAVPDTATTQENKTVRIMVLANDQFDKKLLDVFKVTRKPAHGTVKVKSNKWNQWITYTPNRGFTGKDDFRYQLIYKKLQQSTALVRITVNAAGSSELKAIADHATTAKDKRVKIDVLANDKGVNKESLKKLSITSRPSHGSVWIRSDKRIVYNPKKGFTGQDSFVYRVIDKKNRKAFASVDVKVGKNEKTEITLSWKPSSGNVLGYLVFYGPTSGTITQQLSDLYIETGAVDEKAPSVSYNIANDLGSKAGDNVCFKVKAYNIIGHSNFSNPACKRI